MRMLRIVASIVVIAASAGIATAGGDTAFTYQGRLLDAGEPANGLFEFEFGLWDAANGGNPIGVPQVLNNTPVTDGLFTVQIDFGADAFDNSDRWLEIVVNGVPLSPRQPITRTPYSIQTRGIYVDEDQRIGIGTTNPIVPLHVTTDAVGVDAFLAFSENASAVIGRTNSANGSGIFGRHDPTNNLGLLGTSEYGVYGRAIDVNHWAGYFNGRTHVSDRLFIGREVPISSAEYFGLNAPVGNGAYGGMYISTNGEGAWPFYGYAAGGTSDMWHYYDGSTGRWHLYNGGQERLTVQSDGNVGIGTTTPEDRLHVVGAGGRTVFGENTATSCIGIGGKFESASTTGQGVFGLATATSGFNHGVWGQSNSNQGSGVFGLAITASGNAYGVSGESTSTSGRGVFGWATANSGVTYGVFGRSNSPDGYGVYSFGNVCTTGSYQTCSDGRFKENVQPLADSLDKILKLRGVQFDWKRDEFPDHNFSHDRQVGFIAQEVAKVLPELVAGGEGEDDFYSVSYGRLVPILVEAMKELNGEAQQKDSKITELQARLTALEALVERLDLDRNGGAK